MRISSNQLQSVLQFAKKELSSIYDEREIQSFYYLLCEHFLGMNRSSVILNPDTLLSESELLNFNFSIKDLKKEKPIQYIIGSTYFLDYNFLVDEHTLIPRPETEELVQWIIEEESRNQAQKILDIGTGSGCIAISLAKKISFSEVLAIDLSENALKKAQENARRLNASVEFVRDDILHPHSFTDEVFDLIVSNPPYVLEKEKKHMRKNVLEFEPEQALFVPDYDSLLFYRRILDFAKNHLKKGGKLYFEINEQMGDKMMALLREYHYKAIILKNDLSERPRMMQTVKA
jgi:release factor glutamine methyltransferase